MKTMNELDEYKDACEYWESKANELRTVLATALKAHEATAEKLNSYIHALALEEAVSLKRREALETSSEMMKAMAVQLASWGHETVVNYRGQLAKNAALL